MRGSEDPPRLTEDTLGRGEQLLREWLQSQRAGYVHWQRRLDASLIVLADFVKLRLDAHGGQRGRRSSGGRGRWRIHEPRTKSWKSLREKLEDGRVKAWDLCPDLLGLKVVVNTTEDVNWAIDALQSLTLSAPRRKWWHTSTGRSAGYAAVHLQLAIPRELEVPEGQHKVGFEAQILTELQHAWDLVTHDSFYKPREAVPARLRHRSQRLGAAIDLLDQELHEAVARITPLSRTIRRELQRTIDSGEWRDAVLDEVSLDWATRVGGPLHDDFQALRSLGSLCGFRESGWRESVRFGLETGVFLDYCFEAGINSIGELVRMADAAASWGPAMRALAEDLARADAFGQDSPLFDRPLTVLMVAWEFENPGFPGPRVRPEILEGIRRLRPRFADKRAESGGKTSMPRTLVRGTETGG